MKRLKEAPWVPLGGVFFAVGEESKAKLTAVWERLEFEMERTAGYLR